MLLLNMHIFNSNLQIHQKKEVCINPTINFVRSGHYLLHIKIVSPPNLLVENSCIELLDIYYNFRMLVACCFWVILFNLVT